MIKVSLFIKKNPLVVDDYLEPGTTLDLANQIQHIRNVNEPIFVTHVLRNLLDLRRSDIRLSARWRKIIPKYWYAAEQVRSVTCSQNLTIKA